MKSKKPFVWLKAAYVLFCLIICNSRVLHAQQGGSFVFDGLSRTYTVYVPSAWTAGEELPLLISLHGLTQTWIEMMSYIGFNSFAEENRFMVVYPDGVQNSWNVGFIGGSTADDVGFISALIDTLYKEYYIDLERVYVTGFSNGGFMSYRLACELGNRIAAVAPVAGTMTINALVDCTPQRTMPVMHIHGTNDVVVFYNGGFGNCSVEELLSFWRTEDECPAIPVTINLPELVQEGSTVQKISWAPCLDSTEVLLYKVINGGHTWPGTVGTTGVGHTNRDIIASEEIWEFVSRFSLDGSSTILDEPEQRSFRLYPNPAYNAEILLVEGIPPGIPVRLRIWSIDGSLVSEMQLPGGEGKTISMKGLSPGVYLVNIQYGYSVENTKLIIL